MSSPQTQIPAQQIERRVKPTSVVYWLRFVMGIAAGFTNYFLHIGVATLGDLAIFAGIGLVLLFYGASIFIVRKLLGYGEIELKGKNKYATLGVGTFIVVWIMVSILLNTIGG